MRTHKGCDNAQQTKHAPPGKSHPDHSQCSFCSFFALDIQLPVNATLTMCGNDKDRGGRMISTEKNKSSSSSKVMFPHRDEEKCQIASITRPLFEYFQSEFLCPPARLLYFVVVSSIPRDSAKKTINHTLNRKY